MDFKKDIYQDPEIKKYLKQMAQDQRAFVSLANILFTKGFVEEAIEVCKDGLEKNPNLVAGRAVLGKCFYKLGNKENARVEFENTLKINPENVVALKGLGEIYYGLQIFEKSLDMYKRLLLIDPMNNEFKEMVEKTEKAHNTQSRLREERLERFKNQDASVPMPQTEPEIPQEKSVNDGDAVPSISHEDESYQTSFPRNEQVEESVATPEFVRQEVVSSEGSQQFSQADIDQLIGAAAVPNIVASTMQEHIQPSSLENNIVSEINKVSRVLIELYRMAGFHEDADYLEIRLNGDTSGTVSNEAQADSMKGNVYEAPELTHEGITNIAAESNEIITDTPASVPETEMVPGEGEDRPVADAMQPVDMMQSHGDEIDDIFSKPTSMSDIDDLLSSVAPQESHEASINHDTPAHIVSEDVLHKDDVSSFEITGSENIRWRQGDDADIDKTIEKSDGIVTNSSAAMQMFSDDSIQDIMDTSVMPGAIIPQGISDETDAEVGRVDTEIAKPEDALTIEDKSTEHISMHTNMLSDHQETIDERGVIEDTIPESDLTVLPNPQTQESLEEIHETFSLDDAASVRIPSTSLQDDPFSLDSLPMTEDTLNVDSVLSVSSSMDAVDEIIDSIPDTVSDISSPISQSLTQEADVEETVIDNPVANNEQLTTDENFVPTYRQDAFYSIEDAAQSLSDLQSLMAATEENFSEPVIGADTTADVSHDDILDELSDDEALSKEKAAAMDFTGSSDVMITPNSSETISQVELQKFASREELDMTDMITERNEIPEESGRFEGKTELEMDEIQISNTDSIPISDDKTLISGEIEETLNTEINEQSSFSGKNDVSLGEVSISSQGAPPKSQEISADTLLLPGMEPKKDNVNIDEIITDTDSKNDMDDINKWLKGL